MRTRLFLRTAEFLWQEGHTAHETQEEAVEETLKILDIYGVFAEKHMAIPILKGVKTESERFAGAIDTYCIEALMQDGKALQAGTTHFLGQNFAKAFDVKFATKEGGLDYVWGTSWGVSTRLMGALIMAHSDDNGLILPPNLAPIQVVIVPIYKTEEQRSRIAEKADMIKSQLSEKGFAVHFDNRDTYKPGWKFAEYELKGVPVRVAIGPKDLENNTVEIARRDSGEKDFIGMDNILKHIETLMPDIHNTIFNKALKYRTENTRTADTYDEFKEILDQKGGFVLAHWDGTAETEAVIKDETKATIRLIPVENNPEEGKCIYSGKPSKHRVVFAKAY
jgi:prolyl-tRNA synthetase